MHKITTLYANYLKEVFLKITLIFLFFLFSMVLSAESSINQLKKKVKNQQVSLTNIKKENKTIEFDNQRDIEDLRQLQCFESIEFSKCRSTLK